ncbi:MAG TPA: hypothetical protein DCG12_01380 [Planctomycetaceae bacterium]|nr:hypothetical protein [Planctomycetaceae bacterium]
MKIRPFILIGLIIVLPLAALTWAAIQLAENEQLLVRQHYQELMEDGLNQVNGDVEEYFESLARDMEEITCVEDLNKSRLREINRREPLVLQVFVLNPSGTLFYPNETDLLNNNEQDFLTQTRKMFDGQDLLTAVNLTLNAPGKQFSNGPSYNGNTGALLPKQLVNQRRIVAQRDILNQQNTDGDPFRPVPQIQEQQIQSPSQSADNTANRTGRSQAANQPPEPAQQTSRAPNPQQSRGRYPKLNRRSRGPSQAANRGGENPNDGNSEAFDQQVETKVPEVQQAAGTGGQQLYQSFPDVGVNSANNNTIHTIHETSGWFVWYWERGLNLIYWQRRPDGKIVGCALERSRWISDLIVSLPDQNSDKNIPTRISLLDTKGNPVYQWGAYTPKKKEEPVCDVHLAVPLASWRLQCFAPIDTMMADTGQSSWLGLFTAIGVACVALATFGVREFARDMKEASKQVSFVNQVSHELKTPLTNIRMYAELLDRDLDGIVEESATAPKRRLEVILSEGQRLSRLIGNVLTFARQQRKTLQLQAQQIDPGQQIKKIIDRFRPALTDQQISVEMDLAEGPLINIDPDFLEQILGNLVSNVEKYAGSGGMLSVTSRIESNQLIVDVVDAGPGIPSAKRAFVFEPFSRLSNDVSYAAGTGIGLPIARELARLHGGDVQLLDSESGCWFRATLKGTDS